MRLALRIRAVWRMHTALPFIVLAVAFPVHAQPFVLPVHAQTFDVHVERVPLHIGESSVDVVIHTANRPGLTYIQLHDDENTAATAARSVIEARGGRLIELMHNGDRNVSFTLDDTSYTVDPNRIFTPAGVDSTLSRHGGYSIMARNAVRSFADSLLTLIGYDDLSTVVAVHNNTPDRYSARSYATGGPYESDARLVHLAPGQDADDFFFVTTKGLYDGLQEAGFNVVMQNNESVTDDGSLSVLSGRRGVPYVNAEAEKGHLEEQIRMLATLAELLAHP